MFKQCPLAQKEKVHDFIDKVVKDDLLQVVIYTIFGFSFFQKALKPPMYEWLVKEQRGRLLSTSVSSVEPWSSASSYRPFLCTFLSVIVDFEG